jgi:hypothetical protein
MKILTRVAIGTAVLGVTTFAAIAATEHDNQVFFAINGLKSFGFQQTGYSITSGQPYGGTTAGVSSGKGQITVKAGRKASSSVASWFKQQVGSGQTGQYCISRLWAALPFPGRSEPATNESYDNEGRYASRLPLDQGADDRRHRVRDALHLGRRG